MKKKLLIITPWFLPGKRAGGPIRSVLGLSEMLAKQAEIFIVTPNRDLLSDEVYSITPADAWLEYKPGIYVYYHSTTLSTFKWKKIFSEILPDALYFNNIWSISYTWHPLYITSKVYPDVRKILAVRGMLDENSMKIKTLKKKIFLRFITSLRLQRKIQFHATSEKEALNIREWLNTEQITIIPNLNYVEAQVPYTTKLKGTLKLFFLSRIVPIKNLDFAIRILKKIPSNIRIIYDIYGFHEDTHYVQYCRELSEQLPDNISLAWKGPVSMDVLGETIPAYDALFLPSKNENFGHSMVESMMCGCPVIISDQTPWRNLYDHKAGFDLPLDNEMAFCDALLYLAALDENKFIEWRNAVKAYIFSKIDMKRTEKKYLDLFFR